MNCEGFNVKFSLTGSSQVRQGDQQQEVRGASQWQVGDGELRNLLMRMMSRGSSRIFAVSLGVFWCNVAPVCIFKPCFFTPAFRRPSGWTFKLVTWSD